MHWPSSPTKQRAPYERPPLTKELLRGECGEDELPIEPTRTGCDPRHRTGHRARGRVLTPRPVASRSAAGASSSYEQCVLATGAEPRRLTVPGADDPAVRVLRSLDHFRELTARLRPETRVAVIGSGFIGCEIAASLRRRGHPITLISDEPAPNAARLGDVVGERIAGWLDEVGVEMLLGQSLEAVHRDGAPSCGSSRTRMRSWTPLAIMAAGVTPRLELALGAGLEIRDGAVAIDATMRTSAPGVLAAGDVCDAFNATAGRALRVEHWGDALGQGEVAGRTAAGARRAMGRGPRLLVDDRRPHAEVRGVGRWLRRRHARATVTTGRSPRGIAAAGSWSASSPTTTTTTTTRGRREIAEQAAAVR